MDWLAWLRIIAVVAVVAGTLFRLKGLLPAREQPSRKQGGRTNQRPNIRLIVFVVAVLIGIFSAYLVPR